MGRFVRESVQEMRKVVWPSGPRVRRIARVVVAVLVVCAVLLALDLAFGWASARLFRG